MTARKEKVLAMRAEMPAAGTPGATAGEDRECGARMAGRVDVSAGQLVSAKRGAAKADALAECYCTEWPSYRVGSRHKMLDKPHVLLDAASNAARRPVETM
jgi:hypothetical protein